jgi:hypothetical protein
MENQTDILLEKIPNGDSEAAEVIEALVIEALENMLKVLALLAEQYYKQEELMKELMNVKAFIVKAESRFDQF